MAQMIPDRLPSAASMGEKRLFAALQRLEDDCLVYYEPAIGRRFPDFIVILPDTGVLVIEVKGWYLAQIASASLQDVVVVEQGRKRSHAHPDRQARSYMLRLMDICRQRPAAARLLRSGDAASGFVFPFGRFAILSNITRAQLDGERPDFAPIFASPGIATKDELLAWQEWEGSDVKARLKAAFDPWWPFPPLTPEQIDALRSTIHPEMIIDDNAAEDGDRLKILDLQQERQAHDIGEGHRVVYGVAGSGKTVLLIARAKLLAEDLDKRILVLCFNRLLAEHLANVLRVHPNVTVSSFYRWGVSQGAEFRDEESADSYGERLLMHLQNGSEAAGRYDALLIDEAQDFACSWFHCAKLALKEPDDGDLLIVADGSQSIFRRRSFNWKQAGIAAVGRTQILRKNYRNTAEILAAAHSFAYAPVAAEEGDNRRRTPVEAGAALRRGAAPLIVKCRDRLQECETAVRLIEAWLKDGIDAKGRRTPLAAGDIVILYPRLREQDKPAMEKLRERLNGFTRCVALSRGLGGGKLVEDGVKLMTIMGAKGLQARAVILLWADLLPSNFKERDEAAERGLFYVALTRAEEMLAVLSSGPSRFIDELERNLREAMPATSGAST